ncbi:glycosyltransferase [Candidatus Kaiserbacteria bacterium]|nr:glycosyltransferase [Candidatus Kaiserbacteria bacterium]
MNRIDICIPAYNEGKVIAATLHAFLMEADRHPEVIFRFIVADNASTDDTSRAAESVGDLRVKVARIPEKGKGLAVRTVAQSSDADYFAFVDADLSTDPDDLFRLFSLLANERADIVIGSRLLDETKITRGWWRTLTSKIFNVLARFIVPVGVKDTQCGLKIMNTKGRTVLCEGLETSWFFDIEFLARARRSGLSIKEAPVVWNEFHYPDRVAKLNVWRDGVLAIFAMIRIRARIGRRFSRQWGALLLSLIAGALCVAPALYFAHTAPGYSGIAMTGSDAEEHYTSRVAEVYEGHSGLGNVFLFPKNQPYFAPTLGESIVAGMGAVSGLSPSGAVVLSKFVFPFLIVLLVYALVYGLCFSPIGATLAAAFVVLGDAVLGGPASLMGVLTGHAPITSFLLYARPINPEVSAIFLFSALLILSSFFFKQRVPTRAAIIALGLLAGGALYISVYVSSFLFVVLGLSVLWFLLLKNYVHAKSLIVSIAIGLLAVVPYLLNFLQLHGHPFFAEASIRQGLIHTHAPVIGFWIVVLAVSLFIWPRRFLAARPFFAIGILALVILFNQQVVTGLALQLAHYHWYITKPFVGMVLALFVVFLIERFFKSRTARGVLYIAGLGILLVSAGTIQRASYQAHYTQDLDAQTYAPVLAFLQILPAGQSVWANRTLSLYIPIYTKQDAPNNSDAEYYLVPQAFLEKRLLLEYVLRKVPDADALRAMRAEREDIANRLFGVHWREQYGSYSAIPDSLLERYANDYKVSAGQSIHTQLRALGVSVVVWDTESDPTWNMSQALDTNPIFSTSRFKVYRSN